MAELVPAPFKDLVNRLYRETERNDALYGLQRKKWYVPDASEPDMSVRFHGKVAGNASGPAAGPQTQMAQNLLLSYAGGGRILELKTVQINDRLKIGRPCIDATNVGYNIEWSQELLVEQSLREYVAGMMLIEMFRRDPVFAGQSLLGPPGEYLFDISVGYDLAGIKSEKVQKFLDGMRDAREIIEELRAEIPDEFGLAKKLNYAPNLSGSVTLSTFHGCPAGEIERICEFLIGERDLDVIVKMNPPMLGKERLENLLHEVLGYKELTVNPSAYTSGLLFDESLQLCSRLTKFAKDRRRQFGAKFSNTLEVMNHRTFFTPDNTVQYLSGQPLHVITMTLTDVWRHAVGAELPITFSAGIDSKNFPMVVACGIAPVTICTDLLRPGGYGRLPAYMKSLAQAMNAVGAKTIEDFIFDAYGQREAAKGDVRRAGLLNTTIVADKAQKDTRYRADQNRKVPPRIDSHLVVFDCITCEKCIPVCPNAANFIYPTPKVAFNYQDVYVKPDGSIRPSEQSRWFEIDREMQIANYADFCNECGNCDTFCPEYGGPYIKKPGFYGSVETWCAGAPRDGFVVSQSNGTSTIRGRIKGAEYQLTHDRSAAVYRYEDGTVAMLLSAESHAPREAKSARTLTAEHRVDIGVYHTLRHLLAGVLDQRNPNQINSGK